MKNLDIDTTNLDQSFSNAVGDDASVAKERISFYKQQLINKQNELSRFNPTNFHRTSDYLTDDIKSIQSSIDFWTAKLSAIPKSVIDAINTSESLQSQLDTAEKAKMALAEALALDANNKTLKEKLDKANDISKILSDKLNGTSTSTNVEVKALPSESKIEDKGSFFTMKNGIIGVSIVGGLVGVYFLIKHFKKIK